MSEIAYAESITKLPMIDIPLPGVRGWLSQGADHQIVFFDIEPIGGITRPCRVGKRCAEGTGAG